MTERWHKSSFGKEALVKLAWRGQSTSLGTPLAESSMHSPAQLNGTLKMAFGAWTVRKEKNGIFLLLPEPDGPSNRLVIPNSLQIEWIKSPPYFCVALETGQNVVEQHIKTSVESMQPHKFLPHTQGSQAYLALPRHSQSTMPDLRYLV